MTGTDRILDAGARSGAGRAPRPWAMLAAGVLAQLASAVTVHGPAFLIPTLHRDRGLSLAHAGLVVAAPTVGVMLTLVVWGAAVDRWGERVCLLVGLAGTTLAGLLATQAHGTWQLGAALVMAGAFAASANAASGRIVVGWFPAHRRGLAMGIRQMAQPLGVGLGAVTLAVLADRHGVGTALWVPVVAAAVATATVAAVVVDPPRSPHPEGRAPNPYRGDGFLARVHGVSVLLVVPQFTVWTFALAWLVDARHWAPAAAGALVAASQIAGAFGRIAAGQLSDVVGSRMRPLRWVAVAAVAAMALLGWTAHAGWGVAVLLLVLATTITVADNGLAFTAVAERAGPFWSGRALGVQNTTQFLAASAVAPLAGLAIGSWGYAACFALAAVFPVLAIPLVPVSGEQHLG
ncbi:MAG TPA: MFS transporter [Marmoricola sp.]